MTGSGVTEAILRAECQHHAAVKERMTRSFTYSDCFMINIASISPDCLVELRDCVARSRWLLLLPDVGINASVAEGVNGGRSRTRGSACRNFHC